MTTETQAAGSETTQAGVQATAEGATQGTGATAATTAEQGTQATTTAAEATSTEKSAEAKTEDIAYEFKAPEGVTLDEARLAEFTAFAKDRKLSQADAQALVDMAAKAEAAKAEAFIAQTKAWADEVITDKDLGGDKLAESKAVAMKAIDLGPPELKTFLNSSGLGNHPLLFKWAHRIGKALSEDTFKGGSGAPASGSMADRLYGTSKA